MGHLLRTNWKTAMSKALQKDLIENIISKDIRGIKNCLFKGAVVNVNNTYPYDWVPLNECMNYWDDTHEIFNLLVQAGTMLDAISSHDYGYRFRNWIPLREDSKGIQLIKDAYFEQTGKQL